MHVRFATSDGQRPASSSTLDRASRPSDPERPGSALRRLLTLGAAFLEAMENPRSDLQDRRLAALETKVARLMRTFPPSV